MEKMVWNQWIIIAQIPSNLILSKEKNTKKEELYGICFLHFGALNIAFTQNESFWIDLLTILFKFKSNFYKKKIDYFSSLSSKPLLMSKILCLFLVIEISLHFHFIDPYNIWNVGLGLF
jgi:hypothetical protein